MLNSADLTNRSSLVTFTPFLSAFGLSRGTQNASAVLVEQKAKQDLIATIHGIREAFHREQEELAVPGLDVLGVDANVQKHLAGSVNVTAFLAERAILAPFSVGSHMSQTVADMPISVTALAKALDAHKGIDVKEASTLGDEVSQNLDRVQNNIEEASAVFENHLGKEFGKEDHEGVVSTHRTVIRTMAAVPSAVTETAVVMMTASVDSIGSTVRELVHLVENTKGLILGPKENNILSAYKRCSEQLSIRDHQNSTQLAESLHAIHELEKDLNRLLQSESKQESISHAKVSVSGSNLCALLTSESMLSSLRQLSVSLLVVSEISKHVNAEELKESTKKAVQHASQLGEPGRESLANFGSLTQQLQKVSAAVAEALAELPEGELKADELETLGTTLGLDSATAATVASLPLLVTEISGTVSREISAIKLVSHKDAVAEAAMATLRTEAPFGKHMDEFLTAAVQLKDQLELCSEYKVSMPLASGGTRLVTCGALATSLNITVGLCQAAKAFSKLSHAKPKEAKNPWALDEEELKAAGRSDEATRGRSHRTAESAGLASGLEDASLEKQVLTLMKKMVLAQRGTKRNLWRADIDPDELDLSAKVLVGSVGNGSAYLSATVAATASVALACGISSEVVLRASTKLILMFDSEKASAGPDRLEIGGSGTNLSAASNISRLLPKALESESSVSESFTYMSEVFASRTLFVALTNSRLLSFAIQELSKDEKRYLVVEESYMPETFALCLATQDKLAEKILDKLEAHQEGRYKIAELNEDMASQLAGSSKASICSALLMNFALTGTVTGLVKDTRKASNTKIDLINEDLSSLELLNPSLRSLNRVKAFIFAFIELQAKKTDRTDKLSDGKEAELKSLHYSTQSTAALPALTLSLVSAALFETIETTLSRPLTLIEWQQVQKLLKDSGDNFYKQIELASDQMKLDSALGEQRSAFQSICALRLVVSRFGEALKQIASDLELYEPKGSDVKGELHTVQQTMAESAVLAVTRSMQGVSGLSALVSLAGQSSVGTIEVLQEILRDHVESSGLEWTNYSERCTALDSQTSLSLISLGLMTDTVCNLLTNFFKLGSLIAIEGLEVSLFIAQIMEILSFAPEPSQALSLVSQGQFQPGESAVLYQEPLARTQVTQGLVSIASLIISQLPTESIVDATEAKKKALEAAIDRAIEQTDVLEDAEENAETQGVADIFRVIIKLNAEALRPASQKGTDEAFETCIDILRKGGFALARLHSKYSVAIDANHETRKEKQAELKSLKRLLGRDNAQESLSAFIDKLFSDEYEVIIGRVIADEALVKKFKNKMSETKTSYTPRASALVDYILKETDRRLQQKLQREGKVLKYHNEIIERQEKRQSLFNPESDGSTLKQEMKMK